MIGCEGENALEEKIAEIPIDLDIVRFEQEFYGNTTLSLSDLKAKYPYFFPEQYADSVWQTRMRDSLQLALFAEVNKTFGDFSKEENQVEDLFQHIKYYFPNQRIPKVITLMSDVDYENKVIYADSLLLVSVDTYLGEENPLYDGISQYKRYPMYKGRLTSDMTDAIIAPRIASPENRTLLARMLYYGKLHYAKDLLLPAEDDAVKIGYSVQDIDWVEANEEYMWKYFIENGLLYSTDHKLQQRFIDDAPFSKFFLEFDQESPGSVGQWIGWQVVRSFMKNNEVSLQALFEMDSETLFKKSKYKPKR